MKDLIKITLTYCIYMLVMYPVTIVFVLIGAMLATDDDERKGDLACIADPWREHPLGYDIWLSLSDYITGGVSITRLSSSRGRTHLT